MVDVTYDSRDDEDLVYLLKRIELSKGLGTPGVWLSAKELELIYSYLEAYYDLCGE